MPPGIDKLHCSAGNKAKVHWLTDKIDEDLLIKESSVTPTSSTYSFEITSCHTFSITIYCQINTKISTFWKAWQVLGTGLSTFNNWR